MCGFIYSFKTVRIERTTYIEALICAIIMLLDIINQFYRFHDATIAEFKCQFSNNGFKRGTQKSVELLINCWNRESEKWQTIKIVFIDYTSLRFRETPKIQSHVVFEALLKEDHDGILFDFFPILEDGQDKITEDPNSDFSIRCKEVRYEILNSDMLKS